MSENIDIRGYDKWLNEYKQRRHCNEKKLQQRADEYVRGFIISKKNQGDNGFVEMDENGFTEVPEIITSRTISMNDINPELAEAAEFKRKHKKISEGIKFEYSTIKRPGNLKKAKKLRYTVRKNLRNKTDKDQN